MTPGERDGTEGGAEVWVDGEALPLPEPASRRSVQLALAERAEGTAVVLTVGGNLDMAAAPHLAERVGVVLGRRPEVFVVDLTDVNFLTTAGMSILIEADRMSREHGRSFRLVATGALTLRPMQLLGIDELVQIYPTVEAALAGAHGPASIDG